MLLEVLRQRWEVIAIDTGQHYDFELNGLFYQQLGIPRPDYFLEVGSDTPANQTAAVLTRTADILRARHPAAVVVIGDTNSTLGAALAASKEGHPLVHVEAGLRSSEPNLPEEANRRVVDALADLLCAPSAASAARLRAEQANGTIVNTGDVARDVLLRHLTIAPPPRSRPPFVLATFHRAALTDSPEALNSLVGALSGLDLPILLPLHPRTRAAFTRLDLFRLLPDSVEVSVPLGYLELIAAARDAAVVVTDSGGLQREAYWLGTPCVTIRGETEWTETVACGANALVPPLDAPRLLAAAVADQRARAAKSPWKPDAYGEGKAALGIGDAIADLQQRGRV